MPRRSQSLIYIRRDKYLMGKFDNVLIWAKDATVETACQYTKKKTIKDALETLILIGYKKDIYECIEIENELLLVHYLYLSIGG